MTRTAQDERLIAVKCLGAGGQVSTCIVIVDFNGNIHVNATQRVHHIAEAVEVDECIMRDRRVVRHLRHHLNGIRGAANGRGRIELLPSGIAHVQQRVAFQRDKRHFLVGAVNAREHHRIGAE